MQLRRQLVGSLVAGAALLALAAPAGAVADPPVAVSPSHGAAGSSLQVSGSGCDVPDATAFTSLLDGQGDEIDLGAAAVTAGAWTVGMTTPAGTRPGTYPVAAECSDYGGTDGIVYADGSYTVDFPGTAPTPTGSLTLGRSTVAPGATVEVQGRANPDDEVNIALYSSPVLLTATSVKAGADGGFSATVTIPSGTALGEHTLVAMNTESYLPAVVLSARITVGTTPAATSTGNLASTGAGGAGPAVLVALALMAVGAAGVLSARRPRRAPLDP